MVRRIDVLQIVAGEHRGTGFLIAPDRVVTALHVIGTVERAALVPHGPITVTAAVERGGALEAVSYAVDEHDVIDFDDAFDWACLAVTGLAGVAIHAIAEASDLDEWRSYGFPDSADAGGGKATLGRIISLGAALELGGAVRRVLQLFSLEAGAGLGGRVRGFSGAPVVVGGRAVGMITSAPLRGGVRTEDGTLYAVALPAIAARLGVALAGALPALPDEIGYPAAPYRGLARYTRADARVLFGRDAEIQRVLAAIERPAQGLVLLAGQAGAGKSSLLEAGVLPRLEARYDVRTVRVERSLRAAWQLAGGASWLEAERAPWLVVLDQVEQAVFDGGDVADWIRGDLVRCLRGGRWLPRGRLVLAFRKEWAAELQHLLASHGASGFELLQVPPLDRAAITEVVHAIERAPRYGVTVEPELGARIADALCADPAAARAPTLQIWLTALYEHAPEHRLTREAFDRLIRDGASLGDFLERQLRTLPAAARDSGLGLDLLDFHVGPLVTAIARSHADRAAAYADVATDAIMVALEVAGLVVPDRSGYRLIHDSLAPVVRARAAASDLPAQRARAILDGHRFEWLRGPAVDDARGRLAPLLDLHRLDIVVGGIGAMRTLDAEERALVTASRDRVRLEAEPAREDVARTFARLISRNPEDASPAFDRMALELADVTWLAPLTRTPPSHIALAGDGRTLVFSHSDRLCVVDTARPGQWRWLPGAVHPLDLAISDDGAWVAIAGSLELTTLATRPGGPRHVLRRPSIPGEQLYVATSGTVFIVGTEEVTALTPGTAPRSWPLDAELLVHGCSGAYLVHDAQRSQLIWLSAEERRVQSIGPRAEVRCAPDRPEVVVLAGGVVSVLALDTGAARTLVGPGDGSERTVVDLAHTALAVGANVYIASQHDDRLELRRNAEVYEVVPLAPGEVLRAMAVWSDDVVILTSLRFLWRSGPHACEVAVPITLQKAAPRLSLGDRHVLVMDEPSFGRPGHLCMVNLLERSVTDLAGAARGKFARGAAGLIRCNDHTLLAYADVRPGPVQRRALDDDCAIHLVGDALVSWDRAGVIRRHGGDECELACIALDQREELVQIARSDARWFALTNAGRVHAFSPDGAQLRPACALGMTHDWVAASPDAGWLLAGASNARSISLSRLDDEEGSKLTVPNVDVFSPHHQHAFSSDGRWLALRIDGGAVRVWALRDIPVLSHEIPAPRAPRVDGRVMMRFRTDDQLVILWPDVRVARFDLVTRAVVDLLDLRHMFQSQAALSRDGRWVVVGRDRRSVLVSTDDLAHPVTLPVARHGPNVILAIDDRARWLLTRTLHRYALHPIDPYGARLEPLDLGEGTAAWLAPDGRRAIVLADAPNRASWWRLDAVQALHDQLID